MWPFPVSLLARQWIVWPATDPRNIILLKSEGISKQIKNVMVWSEKDKFVSDY